jgi:ubiquinone/menaquinone biosynthesis C-methylase UbiE
MSAYYANRLSAERLARCYALAPPRMQRYLEQEIAHLLRQLSAGDQVLELGCGTGRVAQRLAAAGARVVGIDVAAKSLDMARREAAAAGLAAEYLNMDALALAFADARFDRVVCVQNGIAAFRVDPRQLVREAWRVLRPGGWLQLSTYSESIWPDRLAWFELQAAEGLVGPIDHAASRDGVIACTDGFRSARASEGELRALAHELGVPPKIHEVDASSLWCEIRKPASSISQPGPASSHHSQGDRRP